MAKIKASESDAYSDTESKPEKGNDRGKKIIDAKPNSIVATMKIQRKEPEDLGYIIDECGVHVDPTKIQFIQDWLAPTTLTELCNFLGLANFYRMFMLGLSISLGP